MANGYMRGEDRTIEQIREHYLIERELAKKLRNASTEQRRHLYTEVYDEMFQRIPHHPMLARKIDPEVTARKVSRDIRFLRRFLNPDGCYLEIGPGDCSLVNEIAKHVKQVYAVDVSEEITENITSLPNCNLIISDGTSIPVASGSVDLAYSNQVMEHLHPDDALEQLHNIYMALAKGGVYICLTPNRISGPHDVSQYFDVIASGFHLKEYTNGELAILLRNVGFSKISVLLGGRGFVLRVPLFPIKVFENIIAGIPRRIRIAISRQLPIRPLLGIKILAAK